MLNFGEPYWWYNADRSVWPHVLAPIATAYGAIAARRMSSPPRYRSRLPVICIGNFTAGGTGKTPTVAMVVRMLSGLGHVPVVLSRGYGGSVREPTWVDASDDTRLVGDEPCELAASCAVLVAPDRVAGAKAIESQVVGCEIGRGRNATAIVMDDGLQNSSLKKDVVIAVVDATRWFGNGRCIPSGPLRAPLASQLPHIDAMVLNGEFKGDIIAALFSDFGGPIIAADVAPSGNVSWLTAQPVVAFAGIGVPERFRRTLMMLGANVREMIAYPDHHAFTAKDAERLVGMADALGALLVTTQKDKVRLNMAPTGPLAELRRRARSLTVELTINPADEVKLADLLARRVPLRH